MRFRKFSKTRSCPNCRSGEVYRLKRSGIANRIVCKFTEFRPHWCANCDTFFYAPKNPKTVRVEGAYGVARQTKVTGNKQPHAGGLAH
jgi:hypothetical protein